MLDIFDELNAHFDEVHYMEFYRDLFPVGSFEKRGIYETGKYNGIAISIHVPTCQGDRRIKRFTVTDDLEVIRNMALTDDFCVMSPISYAGKSRDSVNARFLYALAIDLDGIDTKEQWEFFMTQIENGLEMRSFVYGLPRPTYLVSSGTGVHIYYVFDQPIPLYKNYIKPLEKLKKRLTWQAWTQGASSLCDHVQYESLFQGFRVVGTITKKKNSRCKAFKVGNKVSIEYLNQFVPEEYQIKSFDYESKISLEEAKEKYPDWYKRRIVEGQPRKFWKCKIDLYNWWKQKIVSEAKQGHRYWCIMALAAYAKKCDVPKDVLESDAFELVPLLNSRGDLFTEDDVLSALEAYTDNYMTYPIHTIEERTGIMIKQNKRNGRKQVQHMEIIRAIQQITNPDWRNKDGRPTGSGTKKEVVKEWRRQNPDRKKADCIRDTGLSKPTVYKWWDA